MNFSTATSFNNSQTVDELYLRSPGVAFQNFYEDKQTNRNQDQPDKIKFGSESFVSPYPTLLSPLSSPPSINKQKKRLRRSIVFDECEAVMAELMIPILDDTSKCSRPERFFKKRRYVLNMRKRLSPHRDIRRDMVLQDPPDYSPLQSRTPSPVEGITNEIESHTCYNKISPDQNLEERPHKKMKRRFSNGARAA